MIKTNSRLKRISLALVALFLISLATYVVYQHASFDIPKAIFCERIELIDKRVDEVEKSGNENTELEEGETAVVPEEYCNNTELFVQENMRRLLWIEKQCKLRNVPRLSYQNEIFYFKKSNVGWCPVFKAASSNVFAQFCSDYHAEVICQDKSKNGAGLYRNKPEFKEPVTHVHIPGAGGYKRFLVVRDPLIRLLSAYRDKIEQLREPGYSEELRKMMVHHRPIRWNINFYREVSSERAVHYAVCMTKELDCTVPDYRNPYLYPPYPTFREFVAELIAGWGNPHIVPASQYCGTCNPDKKFDFILKTESFECDMGQMLGIIRNQTSSKTEFSQEYWATNKGPAGNRTLLISYYSTLSSDQLDALLDYYQDDCELFQYPCQGLVNEIRQFKLLNPDHRHEYRNTWEGKE